jgi:cell wall-associated NlpC family hydrolase
VLALVLALSVSVLAALDAPGAAFARGKLTAGNWDAAAQRLVVKEGLMSAPGPAGFAGASTLTAAQANQALAALAARQQAFEEAQGTEGREEAGEGEAEGGAGAGAGAQPVAAVKASGSITVTRFDALVVDQLGLAEVAARVQAVAGEAGLRPPGYFGSEVVARYLGLRYDHPAGEDSLELYPWKQITRAEAAHSFAVVLEGGGWAVEGARRTLEGFALPHYDADQLRVLRIAVAKIGMPYVWGGTTDNTADGLEHGGYDCSGFAWRVYKVSGLPWGAKIHGRTAAEQAGEIPKSARIPLTSVQGGDLLFFGSAHFNSKATEASIVHEGIALSGEWAIHSSGQGVYVLPLDSGWLAQSFAWARRVL